MGMGDELTTENPYEPPRNATSPTEAPKREPKRPGPERVEMAIGWAVGATVSGAIGWMLFQREEQLVAVYTGCVLIGFAAFCLSQACRRLLG